MKIEPLMRESDYADCGKFGDAILVECLLHEL